MYYCLSRVVPIIFTQLFWHRGNHQEDQSDRSLLHREEKVWPKTHALVVTTKIEDLGQEMGVAGDEGEPNDNPPT